MKRISVVGPSGSGKSTVAGAIARRLGVPHLELDSVFHQQGWTPLPDAEFRARVAETVQQDSWVIDGNYARARDLVVDRADTVVWLRIPLRTVMRQVTWRTMRRALLRTELWNGNRESLRNVFSLDPEQSIITWAWKMHGKYDDEYTSLIATAPPGQRWVVLRSRREVRRFLRSAPTATRSTSV